MKTHYTEKQLRKIYIQRNRSETLNKIRSGELSHLTEEIKDYKKNRSVFGLTINYMLDTIAEQYLKEKVDLYTREQLENAIWSKEDLCLHNDIMTNVRNNKTYNIDLDNAKTLFDKGLIKEEQFDKVLKDSWKRESQTKKIILEIQTGAKKLSDYKPEELQILIEQKVLSKELIVELEHLEQMNFERKRDVTKTERQSVLMDLERPDVWLHKQQQSRIDDWVERHVFTKEEIENMLDKERLEYEKYKIREQFGSRMSPEKELER